MTSAATLFGKHVWADTVELVRLPVFSVSTVVFPTMLFLLFGLPNAHSPQAATLMMASYSAYAVIGVTLFQFGVGIANARNSPWQLYLRTLPVSALTRLAAPIVAAILFSAISVGIVMLTAVMFGGARLDGRRFGELALELLLGGIPFGLMGTTIGYLAGERSALPIANILYLPLALGGGFWVPPDHLPGTIALISPFLPTRNYGEILWATVLGQPEPVRAWLWLLGYAVIFAATAIYGYRRDESKRFR